MDADAVEVTLNIGQRWSKTVGSIARSRTITSVDYDARTLTYTLEGQNETPFSSTFEGWARWGGQLVEPTIKRVKSIRIPMHVNVHATPDGSVMFVTGGMQ